MDRRTSNPVRWTHALAVTLSLLALSAALSGCKSGDAAVPVSMSQPNDGRLTCPEIQKQIDANSLEIANAIQADEKTQSMNKLLGVAAMVKILATGGIGALGAETGMDFSKSDQVKFRSLTDRNERLRFLKGEKKC